MTKKLLDRFENSPKVWTIKGEFDDKGNYIYKTKIYNSIADAHRDNPGISCSHIEDYCNATYFTKSNHWFAYVGYKMAPSIQEIIANCSHEPLKENRTKNTVGITYWRDMRDELISDFHTHMWDDIITKFIGEATINVIHFPSISPYYTNYEIAKIVANLKYDDARNFMVGLYNGGWHKRELELKAIDWCKKNITRNNLLERGSEPVVVAEKPEIKYWRSQSYKQENYL